jgi:hypothetical protein
MRGSSLVVVASLGIAPITAVLQGDGNRAELILINGRYTR